MGDDMPLAAEIGLLVILLLLSAFFSGSETALMSLNRYQLRHKAREGHRGARIAEQERDEQVRTGGRVPAPVEAAPTGALMTGDHQFVLTRPATSGLYLLQLRSGRHVLTRKVVFD